MAHAAPSRDAPTATTDLEAGPVLKLGEYADEPTLNTSEARIILLKTLSTRAARGRVYEETETTAKTRDYLEIFAVFKDLAEAQQVEGIIDSYGKGLERFEKSQLGSLVPTCADEAKALIPSLERKVEEGTVSEDELEGICRELQRLKKAGTAVMEIRWLSAVAPNINIRVYQQFYSGCCWEILAQNTNAGCRNRRRAGTNPIRYILPLRDSGIDISYKSFAKCPTKLATYLESFIAQNEA